MNEVKIPERSFAGNKLIAELYAGAASYISYGIFSVSGTEEDLLFFGNAYSVSDTVKVDISGIVASYVSNSVFHFRAYLNDDRGYPAFSQDFYVYPGGLSKFIIRKLANSGIDFFSNYLKNQETNFFLTTRSRKTFLYIPELELMPLYYYAKGLKFSVKSFDNTITLATYDHVNDTTESLQSVDLRSLQQACLTLHGKWPAEFRIITDNGWSCTIVVTLSAPAIYSIRFRNSLSVYERIMLPGTAVLSPAFAETTTSNVFDSVINDFKVKADRKLLDNSLKFTLTDLDADQRDFLTDALLSDSVYFSSGSDEYECRLSTGSEIFRASDSTTQQIDLVVKMVDSDKYYSPMLADDVAVITSAGNEITSNNKDITI